VGSYFNMVGSDYCQETMGQRSSQENVNTSKTVKSYQASSSWLTVFYGLSKHMFCLLITITDIICRKSDGVINYTHFGRGEIRDACRILVGKLVSKRNKLISLSFQTLGWIKSSERTVLTFKWLEESYLKQA
jgi:hypothetical protein